MAVHLLFSNEKSVGIHKLPIVRVVAASNIVAMASFSYVSDSACAETQELDRLIIRDQISSH
jgi:hypothetical protein